MFCTRQLFCTAYVVSKQAFIYEITVQNALAQNALYFFSLCIMLCHFLHLLYIILHLIQGILDGYYIILLFS